MNVELTIGHFLGFGFRDERGSQHEQSKKGKLLSILFQGVLAKTTEQRQRQRHETIM